MKSALLWSIPLLPLLVSKAFLWYAGYEDAKIRNEFEANGFIVLRHFFGDELKEWTTTHEGVFQALFHRLYENGHTLFPGHIGLADDGNWEFAMGLGSRLGFKEIVMRSPGRYEMHVTAFDDALLALLEIPSLDPLLKKLMRIVPGLLYTTEDKIRMDASIAVATAGSFSTEWHTDTVHKNKDKHVSTHILNVAIPLVDVTAEMGPTELYTASHIATRHIDKSTFADMTNGLGPPTAPTLNTGDIEIWDFRVLHRGGPNKSNQVRPILFLAFSRDGFVDKENWPNRTVTDCGIYAQMMPEGKCVRR